MNDDSMIKLLSIMQMDYSPAVESTEAFQASMKTLNDEINRLKANSIQAAKDVGSVFTSQMTGKEIRNAYAQMQKENKPIEVKVVTDKAEKEMIGFAKSMGIKLNKDMKDNFSGLADSMLGEFDQSKFDKLARDIGDAYYEAQKQYQRKLDKEGFLQTDEHKIYDYLRNSTLKLDETTIETKKNVDGFSNAIRNLASQSKDSGMSLDQMGQELEGMGISLKTTKGSMDESAVSTEDIAEAITRAVNHVRDFRQGFTDLGTDLPEKEIRTFVEENLMKMVTSLAQVKFESKQASEELAKMGSSSPAKPTDDMAKSYESLSETIKSTGVVNRKTWEDASGEVYKYTDTLKDLKRNIEIVDTYMKNSEGGFDYTGRTVNDKSIETDYKAMQKLHEEALKMNKAYDDNLAKKKQMAQDDYWKKQFQNVSNTSNELKKMADHYKEQEKLGKANLKNIQESTVEQMKAQAASIQQRATSKELSQEYIQQADIIRGQLDSIQARLQIEGQLTAEEVRQTQELKEQLNILDAQSKTEARDQVRLTPHAPGTTQDRVGWFTDSVKFQAISRAAKETTSSIKDVETSMIDIQRVMSDSSFVLEDYRDELLKLGVDYGQTFENASDIALRWSQSGYNVVDSLKLTETSLLALNAAELDAKNATESMIGIMAQWNLEANDLELVMDKINKTADTHSATSQDLVDGLLRSSGAAKTMNLSLEETLALLVNMREASGRTGKEVGNALNSIISYMQRPAAIKAMEGAGIQMFADEARTQFRSVIDIFEDMSKMWETVGDDLSKGFLEGADAAEYFNEDLANSLGLQEEWNDLQKRDVSQAAAGVHRRNFLIALMERMTNVQGTLNGMTDAAGYSMEKNAQSMETLEKKQESLKASLVALKVAMGDAGLGGSLKIMADGGTKAINAINSMPKPMKDFTLSALTTVSAVKALEWGMNRFGIQIPGIAQIIGNLTSGTMSLTGALKAGAAGMSAFIAANLPLLALSAGVGAIMAIVNAVKKQREEAEKTIEVLREQKEASQAIDDLLPKYEELAKKTGLTTDESQELLEIKERIKSLLPDVATVIDDENMSLAEQVGIIEKLNEQELERAKLKAGDTLAKYGGKEDSIRADLEANQRAYESYMETYNGYLKMQAEGIELSGEEERKMQTLSHAMEILRDSMDGNETKLESINSARELLDNIFKDNTDSVEDNTGAMEDNTSAKESNASATEEQVDKMDDLIKAFNDTTSVIQFYNVVLDELDSAEGLSAKTKQEIINKYHELLPYLEDEAALREYLRELIQAQELEQINSYNNIVMSSESYFNSLLTGNASFYNALHGFYGDDLSNVKTLANAKFDVEKKLIEALGRAWAQYYNASAKAMVFPDADTETAFYNSAEGKAYLAARSAMNAINNAIDNISFSAPSFSGINMGGVKTGGKSGGGKSGGKSGSGSKAPTVKEEKPKYDFDKDRAELEKFLLQFIKKRGELEKEAIEKWYRAEKDALDKIQKEKTAALKKELDDFKSVVNQKIKLLEGSHKEEDYLDNLRKEKEKAREIQQQIDRLELDDSTEARNKKAELRKRLAEQNERVATMEKDKERDLEIEALRDSIEVKEQETSKSIEEADKRFEAEKETLDKIYEEKIASWEKAYSNQSMYAEAHKAILSGVVKDFDGKMVDLRTAYKKFEDVYGSGMGILGDKTKKDFLSVVDRVQLGLKGLHAEAGYVGTKTQNAMSKASESVSSARTPVKNLANDFKNVGREIDNAANKARNFNNNYKFTKDIVGHVGVQSGKGIMFDKGGVVDYTGPAVVHGTPERPEVVFNNPQFRLLSRYIAEEQTKMPKMAPISSLVDRARQALNIGSFITIQGSVTSESIPRIEQIANDGIKQLREVLQVGIR